MNIEDIACLPEGTKCSDCIYMMARIIEPLTSEGENLGLIEVDEDNNVYVQVSCLLLDMDIHDHIVKECSKYEKAEANLLIDHRFL